MLTEDHRWLADLFARYQAAKNPRAKDDLAQRLLQLANLHLKLEESYLRPIVSARLTVTISEPRRGALDPADVRFYEKLNGFITQVLSHSAVQEAQVFPALRRVMPRGELATLGRVLQNAREVRPEEKHEAGSLLARVATSLQNELNDAAERLWWSVLRGHSPRTPSP